MLWLPLVVGLLAAALSLALLAYGPRLGYTLRESTDEEGERLRTLLADVDAPGVDLALRTTSRDDVVECDVLGLPARRTLVVTDAALEHLEDDQLRALLAVEAERGRSPIEVAQALSAGLAVGVIAAAYVTPIPYLPAMLVGWGIVVAAIAVLRRRHYAADAAAGDLVGRGTLRDAIERAAELREDSLEAGGIVHVLFDVEPTVGRRLERLGDQRER